MNEFKKKGKLNILVNAEQPIQRDIKQGTKKAINIKNTYNP